MDKLQAQREHVNKVLRELRVTVNSDLLFVGLLVHAAGIARALITHDQATKEKITQLYADSCVDATTLDQKTAIMPPANEDEPGKPH